ncbi:peptidoglycan-binding protein [Aliiruegeria sabulilitoris]|uniref:peptidoglycan-binding protein n=1 Tax=Aliiruegeria sabulilitoris TaxID=1510458 RepID=UPI00082F336A|nr:peptidoglycan-binding protein [Aliiruegeria sabulilitoris]NDR55406.1 hypothetical protein [Pseudoruegeria sp. M32A2M]
MDRNAKRGMMRSGLLALACTVQASLAWAQTTTPESLFQQARTLVDATAAPYDTSEAAQLRQAREILDRIISEFPASDLSVRVLIQDTIDGLDVARLDAEIATLPTADAAPAFPVIPPPQTGQPEPAGTANAAFPVIPMAPGTAAQTEGAAESPTTGAFPVIPMVQDTAPATSATASGGQATSAFPVIAPPSAPATADPETMVSESLRSVGNCYVSTQGADGGERVIVEVDIDGQGQVAAMPRLLEPVAPSASARQLFITLVTALDSCSPYAAGAAGSYRIAATADGVERVDTSGAPITAAPTTSEAAIIAPAYWVAASKDTQDALELSRREKAELQARLTAMGYNPRGIDGVPGNGTREALSQWQAAAGIPATGYLDQPQMTAFLQQSNPAYEAWLLDDANKAKVEAAATERAATKKSSGRAKTPPGYFWYKGRLCKKVFGNAVISCK